MWVPYGRASVWARSAWWAWRALTHAHALAFAVIKFSRFPFSFACWNSSTIFWENKSSVNRLPNIGHNGQLFLCAQRMLSWSGNHFTIAPCTHCVPITWQSPAQPSSVLSRNPYLSLPIWTEISIFKRRSNQQFLFFIPFLPSLPNWCRYCWQVEIIETVSTLQPARWGSSSVQIVYFTNVKIARPPPERKLCKT